MAVLPVFADKTELARFHKRLQIRAILAVILASGVWFAGAAVYVYVFGGRIEDLPRAYSLAYGLAGLFLIVLFRRLIAGASPQCPHCRRPVFMGVRDEPAVIAGACPHCHKSLLATGESPTDGAARDGSGEGA